MNARPLLVLAALAAATEPDFGKDAVATLKKRLRGAYAEDPVGTTVSTVLAASWLFYRLERGRNPDVRSFYDALVYVSTNLSAGYTEIFAKTAAGKTLGSALAVFGPAMAAKIMEDPVVADAERNDEPSAIVARLDRIVAALERGPTA